MQWSCWIGMASSTQIFNILIKLASLGNWIVMNYHGVQRLFHKVCVELLNGPLNFPIYTKEQLRSHLQLLYVPVCEYEISPENLWLILVDSELAFTNLQQASQIWTHSNDVSPIYSFRGSVNSVTYPLPRKLRLMPHSGAKYSRWSEAWACKACKSYEIIFITYEKTVFNHLK